MEKPDLNVDVTLLTALPFLAVHLKQCTSVHRALKALAMMHYINLRFTLPYIISLHFISSVQFSSV